MALDDFIVLFDTSRGMNLGMRGDRGYGGMGWYLRLLLHPFQGHPCLRAARLATFLAVAQFMTLSGVAVGHLQGRDA